MVNIMNDLGVIAIFALGIPALIGGIWSAVLMWRASKVLFLVSLFIPLFPAIYFYVKYWREKNVSTALYLQLPFLAAILLMAVIAQ